MSSDTGYYASYKNAFNSTWYTLNKKVSDLVSWMTVPLDDIDTFSDNQPWRCGVADNWLVTPAWTCDLTVTFNTNWWAEISSESAGSWDNIILPSTTKMWYVLDGWYDELSGWNKIWDAGDIFTVSSSQILYAQWTPTKDIILEATSASADQTLTINKYFSNAYIVDWWDGSPVSELTADTTHTYSNPWTYNITLSLSWADRWTFQRVYKPLVPKNGTTAIWVKIIYMPTLADGFGANATNPGDYFFYDFNYNWVLTSLPDWSFDTSNIETVGNYFFYGFNEYWQLTSLPAGSFDTSNITIVWEDFFGYFNYNWALESLPANSFDTSNIMTVGNYFFYRFNSVWALTSLPEKSFDISYITTVGTDFFREFNALWSLKSLPAGSFRLSTELTNVWELFFEEFNWWWWLESLPAGSFDISHITSGSDYFFEGFNGDWALKSLPEWSFRLSTWLMIAGDNFFRSFNEWWALMNLPEGSFDTSNITTVGYGFFQSFNEWWALMSLPENSFDTSKITTVGNNFFDAFN